MSPLRRLLSPDVSAEAAPVADVSAEAAPVADVSAEAAPAADASADSEPDVQDPNQDAATEPVAEPAQPEDTEA